MLALRNKVVGHNTFAMVGDYLQNRWSHMEYSTIKEERAVEKGYPQLSVFGL